MKIIKLKIQIYKYNNKILLNRQIKIIQNKNK